MIRFSFFLLAVSQIRPVAMIISAAKTAIYVTFSRRGPALRISRRTAVIGLDLLMIRKQAPAGCFVNDGCGIACAV